MRDGLGNGDSGLGKGRFLGSAVTSRWGWGSGQSCAPNVSGLTSLWWLLVHGRMWVQRTDLWLTNVLQTVARLKAMF